MCFGFRQCFPGASGLESKEWLQLAFLKKKRKGATCGGLGSIFHPPRSLLALYYRSHHCSPCASEPAPWTNTYSHPHAFAHTYTHFFYCMSNTEHKLTCLHPILSTLSSAQLIQPWACKQQSLSFLFFLLGLDLNF